LGYRSIRDVWFKLRRVNILVGPNGCGKSNLYRALYLIAAAANGQFARTLAEEGGMPSVLWAGARSKGPVLLKLGFKTEELRYTMICGMAPTTPGDPTAFKLDPDIKQEEIKFKLGDKWTTLMKREGSSVQARDVNGKRLEFPVLMSPGESVLSGLREPHRFPEVSALRQEILNWRFYHQFRTDSSSPLRRPQIGIRTPVLSHDGTDLAAALQTIIEIGDSEALHQAVNRAFPNARLSILSENGEFETTLQMPDFHRPFLAKELSDGTLQYLCLLAALLSPRPPSLLALNEPETSIHPDLFTPLVKLIADAGANSQLWITTHAGELADHILDSTGESPIELKKTNGATEIVGTRLGGDDD
jgi:predicted ATPase